jgi:superkiller protein 3
LQSLKPEVEIGEIMRLDYPLRFCVLVALLIVCAAFMGMESVYAQESNDIVGGASETFKPANPVTRPSRRREAPRAKKVSGDSLEELLDEGNEARDERKYQVAERAYRNALGLDSEDWRAHYGLGNIYTDQQRWEDAEQSYRKAITFNAMSADAFLALSFVLVQPRLKGNAARRLIEAEQYARHAIVLQPNNAITHDRLGEALSARALLGEDTERAYRRAVELDPRSAVAHIHLAILLSKTGRTSEAQPFYEKAVGLAKDAPTLVLIAESMQSRQLWNESEPLLRRALETGANNPRALVLLGRMLVAKKRYTEAEPFLKRAIGIIPQSFRPYYILGSAYVRMERHEEAEQVLMKAKGFASPEELKELAGAYALGGVADGYMQARRPSDALRVYEYILTLDKDNTDLQNKINEARNRIGSLSSK